MAFIPEPAWGTIMSYLHDEYDWEKKAVVDELNQKCAVFGGDECMFIEFVPSLMLPTKCVLQHMASKYRNYHNQTSISTEACHCAYCQLRLWNIY
jgi:hypothetical protein